MGLLRLLLAVSVVLEHSGPLFGLKLLGGVVAVQVFYLISGFYMAMVLQEKYVGPGSYRLFVSNRCLRIFPAYWAVLALTLAFWSGMRLFAGSETGGPLEMYGRNLDPFAFAYLVLANVLILGQDAAMFLGLDQAGQLFFAPDFRLTDPPMWKFLLVAPAWSLDVELCFYFLAPFLVRRKTTTLLGLILASLALRSFIYVGCGLDHDPWTYRFFPTELAFFLAGALIYRIYPWLREHPLTTTQFLGAAACGLMFLAGLKLAPHWRVLGFDLKHWGFYVIACAAIPLLFALTKRSKLDRYVGELSYPVYICHSLVIAALTPLLSRVGGSEYLSPCAIVISIAFSMGLIHLVMNPIERIRQNRVTGNARAMTAVLPASMAPIGEGSRKAA